MNSYEKAGLTHFIQRVMWWASGPENRRSLRLEAGLCAVNRHLSDVREANKYINAIVCAINWHLSDVREANKYINAIIL